jgi:hypothetical protein
MEPLPADISAFVRGYPGEVRVVNYNKQYQDWLINVNGTDLYWAGSRFLPQTELSNINKWRPYLDYTYSKKIPDPEDSTIFTKDFIAQLKSDEFYESRRAQNPYYTAFYDALYDCATRGAIEKHIVKISFLGHNLNIHEKLVPAIKRVEKEIYLLKDKEIKHKVTPEYGTVQFFLEQIADIQGYSWREVSDTSNPSQHSRGIAIDILPKEWSTKNMYWRWRADWDDDWMLLSLDRRWMPALDVVKAFEKEGFIWGGKWYLWDDMHFEYRPELFF